MLIIIFQVILYIYLQISSEDNDELKDLLSEIKNLNEGNSIA